MRAFETKVWKYIQELKMISCDDRVLVAVSGGMDSMALLHFLYKYRIQLQIELCAVHVDHMLRGEQSAEDCRFVEAFCKERHITIFSKAIPIPSIIEEENGNVQAICRRERYRYFEETMEKQQFNKLVTAHHADDQLESILMALTKGAIVKGIQGIQAIRPLFENHFVVRPFLAVTKEEIGQYLKEQGVCYREDMSNSKDDYLRNRLRHYVLPLLKAENDLVSLHAVHLAKHLQEDADYLMEQAQAVFSRIVKKTAENVNSMEIDAFQKESLALQKRIILILLNYLYKCSNTIQSYALWTSILKLCETTDGSSEVHLPEGYKAVRCYHQLTIFKPDDIGATIHPFTVSPGQWEDVGRGIRLYISQCTEMPDDSRNSRSQVYYFSSQDVTLPFVIRGRQEGDRIALKGMSKQKRLSRLFIDEKIPFNIRDSIPVLVSGDEVIAVIGVRVSKYFSTEKRVNDDCMMIVSFASLQKMEDESV